MFVLAPTAPPWLADQQSYISGVHHILKQALADLRMDSLAAAEGDGRRYDITAAMPSLHPAFALLCVFGARRRGLAGGRGQGARRDLKERGSAA